MTMQGAAKFPTSSSMRPLEVATLAPSPAPPLATLLPLDHEAGHAPVLREPEELLLLLQRKQAMKVMSKKA
jgi:hypothetical protein